MSPALIALAVQVGAPLVENVLARKFGTGSASLARTVIDAIAKEAGVPAMEVEALAEADPGRVSAAIQAVEPTVPEMIDLYAAELAAKLEIFAAEKEEPLWVRAWRPLGMYGLGFLWFWNIIILHALNAIWKIALPQADLGVLMQLTALYLTLYMGGHLTRRSGDCRPMTQKNATPATACMAALRSLRSGASSTRSRRPGCVRNPKPSSTPHFRRAVPVFARATAKS